MQLILTIPIGGEAAASQIFDEHGRELQQIGDEIDFPARELDADLDQFMQRYVKPCLLMLREESAARVQTA